MNKIPSLLLAAAILLTANVADAAHPAAAAEPPTKFETVPPGEAGQIGKIVGLTVRLLQKRYGDGFALRGVHPKDHGCVKAAFTVNSDLPEKYRAGVFATPGKKYDAWIRFSNATGTVTPDIGAKGAASRGMAIKLLGVEGDTLLDEAGAKTQDFLLINQPGFAFPNVSEYLAATQMQSDNFDNKEDLSKLFAPPRSPEREKTFAIASGIAVSKLANPLDAQYFSASPFLFGKDNVAKFSAKPRDPANPSLNPARPPPNYLREAMKKSLNTQDGKPAIFDFQVQLRTSESLPIEDASAEWKETDAPFRNVATITIDRQNFDTPRQVTECEHLVLTPWHGLAAHRPLGGINRLRLEVYIASSQFREQSRKPTGFPKWPW